MIRFSSSFAVATGFASDVMAPPAPNAGDSSDDPRIKRLEFISGLLALLTPCVFPMIPMTVSFFMQGQSSKFNSIVKALIFGISIVVLTVYAH